MPARWTRMIDALLLFAAFFLTFVLRPPLRNDYGRFAAEYEGISAAAEQGEASHDEQEPLSQEQGELETVWTSADQDEEGRPGPGAPVNGAAPSGPSSGPTTTTFSPERILELRAHLEQERRAAERKQKAFADAGKQEEERRGKERIPIADFARQGRFCLQGCAPLTKHHAYNYWHSMIGSGTNGLDAMLRQKDGVFADLFEAQPRPRPLEVQRVEGSSSGLSGVEVQRVEGSSSGLSGVEVQRVEGSSSGLSGVEDLHGAMVDADLDTNRLSEGTENDPPGKNRRGRLLRRSEQASVSRTTQGRVLLTQHPNIAPAAPPPDRPPLLPAEDRTRFHDLILKPGVLGNMTLLLAKLDAVVWDATRACASPDANQFLHEVFWRWLLPHGPRKFCAEFTGRSGDVVVADLNLLAGTASDGSFQRKILARDGVVRKRPLREGFLSAENKADARMKGVGCQQWPWLYESRHLLRSLAAARLGIGLGRFGGEGVGAGGRSSTIDSVEQKRREQDAGPVGSGSSGAVPPSPSSPNRREAVSSLQEGPPRTARRPFTVAFLKRKTESTETSIVSAGRAILNLEDVQAEVESVVYEYGGTVEAGPSPTPSSSKVEHFQNHGGSTVVLKVFDPSDLTVPEQASIFLNTDVVIFMHGAVAANIIWLPIGALVLEIDPADGWHCQHSYAMPKHSGRYNWVLSLSPSAVRNSTTPKGFLKPTKVVGSGLCTSRPPNISATIEYTQMNHDTHRNETRTRQKFLTEIAASAGEKDPGYVCDAELECPAWVLRPVAEKWGIWGEYRNSQGRKVGWSRLGTLLRAVLAAAREEGGGVEREGRREDAGVAEEGGESVPKKFVNKNGEDEVGEDIGFLNRVMRRALGSVAAQSEGDGWLKEGACEGHVWQMEEEPV